MTNVMGSLTRCAAFGLVVGFLSSAPVIGAEPKAKKPKAAAGAGPVTAHVRVWKDVFEVERPVKLVVRSGKKSGLEVRLSPGLQFLQYQETAGGPVSAEVIDDEDGKTKLLSTNLAFDDGGFYTLLLHETGGRITIEAINDSVQPSISTGEISVRSFAPKLATLRVKIGDDITVKLDGPGPFASFRGLPRRVMQIDTSGAESSGKPINWTNELDLKVHQRATLIVVPDASGRIRPRILFDGVLPPSDP